LTRLTSRILIADLIYQREQRAMMRFLVVTHLEAGVWAGEQLVAPCSAYLLRPLRTFRQACSDISASHPELLLPEFDAYTNIETSTMHDYTLAIKNKGRPPKSWRWEIYEAGKNKPVRQSEFFETMSEATRTGKTALAELRANRAA
jgi:hypothetical protein